MHGAKVRKNWKLPARMNINARMTISGWHSEGDIRIWMLDTGLINSGYHKVIVRR